MGETDHSTYAILYYQKGRSISVKLYGGSVLRNLGSRRVGNPCWAQGMPAIAPEDPEVGMESLHAAQSSSGGFWPQTLWREEPVPSFSELKDPLALSLAMGGHGGLWGRAQGW